MKIHKIYTWSVMVEQLGFFSFALPIVGFNASLSRFLQIIFLVCYLISYFTKQKTPKQNINFTSARFLHVIKRKFFIFLIIGVSVSGLYFQFTYYFGNSGLEILGINENLAFFRSPYVNPYFEILSYLYYFYYFSIFPLKLFKTKDSIIYFIRMFLAVFWFNLFVGYFLYILSFFSITLIPRRFIDVFYDSINIYVSQRFVGLGGEPRYAFVYLVLGCAMYLLLCFLLKMKVNKGYVTIIALALVLCFSMSVYISVAIFFILTLILGTYFKIINLSKLIIITAIITPMIFVTFLNSGRVYRYFDSAGSLYNNIIEKGVSGKFLFPAFLVGEMPNIYPGIKMLSQISELELLPVFFGNGIGTANLWNKLYLKNAGLPYAGTHNPKTLAVRIVFEFGIIGFFLFILFIAYPIVLLIKLFYSDVTIHARLLVFFPMIAVLAAGFSQKSAAPYIYLGIASVSLILFKKTKLLKI
jgi:hypothetical protein